jgi:hypothetical protein
MTAIRWLRELELNWGLLLVEIGPYMKTTAPEGRSK